MSLDLILLILCLLLSGFFSGTETAYTVVRRIAVEVYVRHNRVGSKVAQKFASNTNLLFTIVLVANNLVAVVYSSVAALFLRAIGVPMEIVFIVSPLLLLVFGEILPKTLARDVAEKWVLLSAWPLRLFYWLLWPLVIISSAASKVVLFLFGEKSTDRDAHSLTLTDLRVTWHELRRSGQVDWDEAEMLDRVVTLRHMKLRSAMTPRPQIVGIPENASREEVVDAIHSSGYSRFPVYRENIDHIVGILLAWDLLRNDSDTSVLIRPALFVPLQSPVAKVISKLKEQKTGMAIVVDEHGGTAGLITIEDLVEEIVGEIDDEFDRHSFKPREVAHGAFLLPGVADLDMIRRQCNITLPEGDYETVAGLVIDRLKGIPEPGATIQVGSAIIRVADADDRRIKRVLVRARQPKSN